MMLFSSSKMCILNKMFSRNMINHFINGEVDNTYKFVVENYFNNYLNKKNKFLINKIYCLLNNKYRNEYFYKNTLLNKLLFEFHNINTTAAFTELVISKSKADFVLINGRAVVYEIKTELDNLDRLKTQINDYYKAFNYVVIVTYEKNIKHIINCLKIIKKPVGIYIINNKSKIVVIKKAKSHTSDLNKETLFKLLRKHEYEEILYKVYKYLPNVTQFEYYSTCKKMFENITINKIYKYVLDVLKKRMNYSQINFRNIPYELKFNSYFMNMSINAADSLKKFLNSKYGGA